VIVWLIYSVWPSVCGYNEVLIIGLILSIPRDCFYSVVMNLESRSEVMSIRI
jgi:hypothetical protein